MAWWTLELSWSLGSLGRHRALLTLALWSSRAIGLHRPPPGESSRGFLGGKGAWLEGLMSGPGSPRASRTDGGACLPMSHRLCDFVGGVGDNVVRPLVGAAPRRPRALDARQAWSMPGS